VSQFGDCVKRKVEQSDEQLMVEEDPETPQIGSNGR